MQKIVLKHDNKVIDYLPPKKTIYELLNETHQDSERIAIHYKGTDITYKQLFRKIEKTVNSFVASGIKKGDTVSVLSPGFVETIYILYAMSYLGIRGNFVNPMFSLEDINEQIRNTNSKMLMIYDGFYDRFYKKIDNDLKNNTVIIKADSSLSKSKKFIYNNVLNLKNKLNNINKVNYNHNTISWEDFIKKGNPTAEDYRKMGLDTVENFGFSHPGVSYDKDRVLAILYTSGTTGKPKGVSLTEDTFNSIAIQHKESNMGFAAEQKFLNVLHPFLAIWAVDAVHMPLLVGVTTIVEPGDTQETFTKNIKKHKPQHIIAPPSKYNMITKDKVLDKEDLSFFMYPTTGGESHSIRELNELNEYYKDRGYNGGQHTGAGLSEVGSVATVTTNTQNEFGTCGMPLVYTNVKVFDDNGIEVAPNIRGNIFINTPAMLKEYYNNEEATKEVTFYDENNRRWLYTGDIGTKDEFDNVKFIGRKSSSSIKTKLGTIVYTAELDRLIEGKNIKMCRTTIHDLTNGKQLYVHHLGLDKEQMGKKEQVISKISQKINELSNEEHAYRPIDNDKIPYGLSGKINVKELKEKVDQLLEVSNKEVNEYSLELTNKESLETANESTYVKVYKK